MIKTALTTAIVLASASAALAFEFDPNPANRYPAFAGPVAAQTQTFRSAPVALEGRNVALTGSQVIISGTKTYDREGASHDGGTSN
jgi:hypothetical protein